MKILAIDASTIAASAAVAEEKKLHGEIFTDYKLKHSEKLLVMVDSLLKNLRMDICEMDAFAVCNGPGSFTGLRIALATTKGFAMALNKPIITVSTLDCLAHSAFHFDQFICPILDAQRSQVYAALYKKRGNVLEKIIDEGAYDISSWINQLKEKIGNEKILFSGDATLKYFDRFAQGLPGSALVAEASIRMPKASYAAKIALEKAHRGEIQDAYTAMPNYIRLPQAEENFKEKER